jgi:TP901 family phage tail tape measure protein
MADIEDILVRLSAQANTNEVQKFGQELDRIRQMAVNSGTSQVTANKLAASTYTEVASRAAAAKMSLDQYLRSTGLVNNMYKEMEASVRRVGQAAKSSFDTQQEGARKAAEAVRELIGRYAGWGAVIAGLKQSVEAYAEFDRKLRVIQNQSGATRAQIDAIVPTLRRLSRETGEPMDKLVDGFDTLRERADLSVPAARRIFNEIARGAAAAGVPARDMAETFASMTTSMGIKGREAAQVMEQLVAASQTLGLDIGQLTHSAPRLAEIMGQWGYQGKAGTAAMLAWLAQVRKVEPGTQAAATAMTRFMQNLAKPELATALNMPPKYLIKILDNAKAAGRDVLSVYMDLVKKALAKGTPIEQLFPGRDGLIIRQFLRSGGEVQKLTQDLQESSGRTGRSLKNMAESPAQAISNLKSSLEDLKVRMGEFATDNGLIEGMQEVIGEINTAVAVIEGLQELLDTHHLNWEAFLDAAGLTQRWDRMMLSLKTQWQDMQDIFHGRVRVDMKTGNVIPTSPQSQALHRQLEEMDRKQIEAESGTGADRRGRQRQRRFFNQRGGTDTEGLDVTTPEELDPVWRKTIERLQKMNEVTDRVNEKLKQMSYLLPGSGGPGGGPPGIMNASYSPGGGFGGGGGGFRSGGGFAMLGQGGGMGAGAGPGPSGFGAGFGPGSGINRSSSVSSPGMADTSTPPAFRTPTSPENAPQSLRDAVSGGFSGAAGVGNQPGDITPRGVTGGRFNAPAGTRSTQATEGQTVTLSNGQKVTVNKAAAPQFEGFFNDLIKAGAPVGSLGGFGTRNLVSPRVQSWISQNPQVLSALEKKWGMSGGEHWRNPDTGHFSVDTLFGSQHLSRMRGGAGGLGHMTTDDLARSLGGAQGGGGMGAGARTAGGIDRSSFGPEIAKNPDLMFRSAAMVAGEVYPERATDRAKRVQLETAFNRAQYRGHSLDQALWSTAQHGKAGYYPQQTFNRGAAFVRSHPDWYKNFQENVWGKVMGGSDEARGFSGNASADVAARQRAKGTPYMDLRREGGDQYFKEGPFRNALPRLPMTPTDTTVKKDAPEPEQASSKSSDERRRATNDLFRTGVRGSSRNKGYDDVRNHLGRGLGEGETAGESTADSINRELESRSGGSDKGGVTGNDPQNINLFTKERDDANERHREQQRRGLPSSGGGPRASLDDARAARAELSRPIPLRFTHENAQFSRASIRHQANKEVRDSLHHGMGHDMRSA